MSDTSKLMPSEFNTYDLEEYKFRTDFVEYTLENNDAYSYEDIYIVNEQI